MILSLHGMVYFWSLIELPYWFIVGFWPKTLGISLKSQVKFNPHEVRLNIETLKILEFYEFLWSFRFLVQSEVKKIILVKSSLREVRSSHQSNCSLSNSWNASLHIRIVFKIPFANVLHSLLSFEVHVFLKAQWIGKGDFGEKSPILAFPFQCRQRKITETTKTHIGPNHPNHTLHELIFE